MKDEVLKLWLPDTTSNDATSDDNGSENDSRRPIHLIDGTIGVAGHTLAAIRSTTQQQNNDIKVLGIDRDPEALSKARKRLVKELDEKPNADDDEYAEIEDVEEAAPSNAESSRATLHLGSFADISPGLLSLYSFPLKVNGILMDCGMNSFQIENKQRGFSFRQHGPLDMRFDMTTRSHKVLAGQSHRKIRPNADKARDIVNTRSAAELSALFAERADEPYADEIASSIVEWRSNEQKRERKAPVGIRTTLELRYVVEECIAAVLAAEGVEPKERFPPKKFYAMWRAPTKRLPKRTKDKLIKKYAERKPRHVNHVMRVFQALRMEVNDELLHIQSFFDMGIAERCLEVGGRLVMIAFHPGEDEIIRKGMESMVKKKEEEEGANFKWVTPEVEGLRPTLEEVKMNGRSRSARLRAVERIR